MQHAAAYLQKEDTILALSTPPGVGALALIRLSGKEALRACDAIFYGKKLAEQASHTLHFGQIRRKDGQVLDEVVVGLYRGPRSYTREDTLEISCHASEYIIQELMQLLLDQGLRLAEPGEFTQRAFLNGQLDLAQAEAVADLIASNSARSHELAMQQMRGGYSEQIRSLREQFIKLAALLELELDFSEEDVEFADRTELKRQLAALSQLVDSLLDSFRLGNAIKNGVPVAIAGRPNAGKSTLLNALLQDDKALVSDIPGTTRDSIEDERIIEGIRFRFIDTAGLRNTEDVVEQMGIARSKEKIAASSLLLYLFDASQTSPELLEAEIQEVKAFNTPYLLLGNKLDLLSREQSAEFESFENLLLISALEQAELDQLEKALLRHVQEAVPSEQSVIVSNLRHYESLQNTQRALQLVEEAMAQGLSTELVASDIREAVYHLGSITGEVTNEDLLDFIFREFCIGK